MDKESIILTITFGIHKKIVAREDNPFGSRNISGEIFLFAEMRLSSSLSRPINFGFGMALACIPWDDRPSQENR
jgi:hypothetical protein